MVRWEPGAKERLRGAALDLYLQQGFEQTTVADIARSVGLSERTFFRHYADKREVLFDGQDLLQATLVNGVDAEPDAATPLNLVGGALAAAAALFPDERRDYSRRRQAVIAANPALHERELLKLAGLAAALGAALRDRGVPEPTATIAAQSGVTVFAVAFGQWIAEGETRPFTELGRQGLTTLGDLAHAVQSTSSIRSTT